MFECVLLIIYLDYMFCLQVDVVRYLILEELFFVFIFYFKFFVYDKDGGSQKLFKNFEYGIDFEIIKGKGKRIKQDKQLMYSVVC